MNDDNLEDGEQRLAPLDRDGWLTLLGEMGEEAGYFKPLGTQHWALFNDDGPTLLITFDRLENIRTFSPGQMPFCFKLATQYGWSHLSIIAEGETWYRDPAIYAFFDSLVDNGFLDSFDRVVLYGAEMGAYAACAYSVAAPGSTVVAIQPRATLDPSVAGWDRRNLQARKLCFTDRYGYAPDMIEGSGAAFSIFDPNEAQDAMHAALFSNRDMTRLRVRSLGSDVAKSLLRMDILPKIIQAACKGQLTKERFFQLYRARCNDVPYLRRILLDCADKTHPEREAKICRSVIARMRAPGFRRHLAELEEQGRVRSVTPKDRASEPEHDDEDASHQSN